MKFIKKSINQMINLIACVSIYKNKLAIGRSGELLFKLENDTEFFKEITMNSLSSESKLDKNIVLMGRKTYFSISEKYRPLSGRINIVLTNDSKLIKTAPVPVNLKLKNDLYFTDIATFIRIYRYHNPNVFVIGGSYIYNMFLNNNRLPGPHNLYLTNVQSIVGTNIKFPKGCEPNIFMDCPNSLYKLVGYSDKYYSTYNNLSIVYRILTYKIGQVESEEYKYLDLMGNILKDGNIRDDRTDIGTISIFGTQMRFDISNSIPLLTTKRVSFKTILHELLWILQGHTDAKILQKDGVHIWDGNTSREFLDKSGLYNYPEGVLGAGYGFQLRNFGAKYNHLFSDTSKCNNIGGIDQLDYVEHLLKTDPFSRRIIYSYWNPSDFDKTALLPCHVIVQFYVTEISNQKYLSCQFYMRSNDILLGNPYNLVFYSVLTYILAMRCNMKPKDLVYSCGDCHIYNNHIDAVKEQLTRTSRPFPKLKLDSSIKDKNWSDITTDDFELIGYMPHPSIKAPMAI